MRVDVYGGGRRCLCVVDHCYGGQKAPGNAKGVALPLFCLQSGQPPLLSTIKGMLGLK